MMTAEQIRQDIAKFEAAKEQAMMQNLDKPALAMVNWHRFDAVVQYLREKLAEQDKAEEGQTK